MTRFDSQFWRMNCQIFSWLFSSGERGGNGISEMLCGTFSSFALPAGLIEDDDGVGARADLGGDLVEMKLHGFAVTKKGGPKRRRFRAQGIRHRTGTSIACVDRA